jgi:hypothetical protein
MFSSGVEVDDGRSRVEGPLELLAQQGCEILPARDQADPLRELLQDQAGVVGVAEERAIDETGRAPDRGRRHPGQEEPEADARGGRERGLHLERPAERQGEEGGGLRPQQHEQHREPALDEDVARAALEEDGQLQHLVLHHRVGEGEREEEDDETRERPACREEESEHEQHPLQEGQPAIDRRARGEGSEEQVEGEGEQRAGGRLVGHDESEAARAQAGEGGRNPGGGGQAHEEGREPPRMRVLEPEEEDGQGHRQEEDREQEHRVVDQP